MDCIIHPDGTTIHTAPKSGPYYSLAELQKIVGGYIEIISMPDRHGQPPGGMVMVLNEEGKIHDLPINETATELASRDTIVGTVLICQYNSIK